jgi:hypothetical protein
VQELRDVAVKVMHPHPHGDPTSVSFLAGVAVAAAGAAGEIPAPTRCRSGILWRVDHCVLWLSRDGVSPAGTFEDLLVKPS